VGGSGADPTQAARTKARNARTSFFTVSSIDD
jgi:hypothetical protein